jgi:hypothetical protein
MIQDFSHQNKEWENPVFIKKPEKCHLAMLRYQSGHAIQCYRKSSDCHSLPLTFQFQQSKQMTEV